MQNSRSDNIDAAQTCTDRDQGEHQGCQCETPPDIYVNWASNEEQQAMLLIDKLLGAIKDKPNEPERPTANCDMDNLSEIPGNVFGGPKNNVYHHFCESWLDDAEFKMRVDAAGSNKDPEIIKQKKIQGRTPPPNPDVYKVYDFNLGFESSGGDGKKECAQNCTVAFDTLWSACSNSGGTSHVLIPSRPSSRAHFSHEADMHILFTHPQR